MLLPKQNAFVNPNDSFCARTLWLGLLVVYVIYGTLATLALKEEAAEAETLDFHEEKIPLPRPSVDVCELLSTSSLLNYSILKNVHVKVQSGWFWRSGNESHTEAKIPAVAEYQAEQAFRCLRYSSTIEIPTGAAVTYYNFWIGVEEPVHPKLYRWNENYIGGLVFRPSLSANATNSFAWQQERMMRVFVPTRKMPGFRNVVISARPSLAKWTDSLGGRLGAPCEDTFYLADLTLIPETLQREALRNESEAEDSHNKATNSSTPLRYTLKLDMPVATQLVAVSRFENDLVTSVLKWLSKMASATALFKLVVVLFPVVERRRYGFALHVPRFGLGLPSETTPLMPKEDP